MFNNTVILVKQYGDGVGFDTSIINLGDGRSSRADATGNEQLSIAQTESNENPGFTTKRSNVRILREKTLEGSGKTVKAYAQLTLSVPTDQVTVAEVQEIVTELINFIRYSENATSMGLVAPTDLLAIPRLLAGEP